MEDSCGDFCPDSESLSPQASTDEKSIHHNWHRNREALQKRLSIRRPVDDLVNNGIMMSPLKTPPCYAEKMRQLERAKTSDLLKQKIQHRPDAQSLVDRHILPEWPPDEIGRSPQVFEQQQLMRRYQLMSSLNSKLEHRPGSLEMAEKGLLPLAPPMQTLLRDGSISYPRVDETVSEFEEFDDIVLDVDPVPQEVQTPAIPAPTGCVVTTSVAPTSSSFTPSISLSDRQNTAYTCSLRRSRPPHGVSSRSRKTSGIGTSKVGNFVFHTYNPPKKMNTVPTINTPDSQPVMVDDEVVPKPAVIADLCQINPNTARQIQQAEYLKLQESEDKQNVLMQQLVNDIRSRHTGGGSPMKVQRSEPSTTPLQPSTSTTTSGGFVAFSGLASLNVQQLKEECRRYRVPRTGNKMNLIRNLEPYQQEILRRYVISATTSPTLGSPASSQVSMATGLATTNGSGTCMEDQSMRHSSSAPQLNIATAPKMQSVAPDEISTDASSPQGQWSSQAPTATTLIVLNQTGSMTLQPLLVTPQGMVTTTTQGHQVPPPPPPPPPPPNPTLLIRQTPQPQLQSQPSSPPEGRMQMSIKEDIDDETELIRRVEELERQIVENIQESDAYKASHNGSRNENIERLRQVLMINYTNLKRQAKAQLQERIDNTKAILIELCEKEATYKEQGNLQALDALERQRELVLGEYNRWNGILAKIKANSTPNASVSSETRIRSFTETGSCSIPNLPLNRSITVGESDLSRSFSSAISNVNGNPDESMSKHIEKRLPSVEFQMLNEVLSEEHLDSKMVSGKTMLNDSNGVTDPALCDFSTWLNETSQQPQYESSLNQLQLHRPQTQQVVLTQTSQSNSHPSRCAAVEVGELPMSPMQTDFSSRCSTPLRPGQADPSQGGAGDQMQGPPQFNFDDFLCHPNMDIGFPSLGGHPSAASMTEQILTPNTQNALYQFIQPDVVNMETDNDVFAP